MLFIADHGLVFLHIPKNAGQAMRRALEDAAPINYDSFAKELHCTAANAEDMMESRVELPGVGVVQPEHLPLDIMQAHFPLSFSILRASKSFVLVRAPRDRFFSALLQRLGEFKNIKSLRADDPRVMQEARVVCEQLAKTSGYPGMEFIHFSRQIDYVELAGERIVNAVFALDQIDAAARWIAQETGLLINVQPDHVRREPKPWARAIQQPARFIGRNLIPRPVKRAIYPLWVNSGVFANAASRYKAVSLDKDVEDFIAQYYAADAALYQEACAPTVRGD